MGQIKSFPADFLEDGAGEVVHHRIQRAVEIGHADGDVKCRGQVLQGWADFRFMEGVDCLLGPDPNQQLCNVAREEANNKEHHHHYEEVQSLLDLCMLCQLSPSQVANNAYCAVDNHKQRYIDGKHKLKFMPGEIMVSVNHEALAIGRVDVFQRQEMSIQGNGEQPQCNCSTHGFGDTQMVDGMMGTHHTHVPVHSDSHQEEGTSTAVHCQHEEADVAESISKHPLDPRDVVAGTERQSKIEQKVSHCQVEE